MQCKRPEQPRHPPPWRLAPPPPQASRAQLHPAEFGAQPKQASQPAAQHDQRRPAGDFGLPPAQPADVGTQPAAHDVGLPPAPPADVETQPAARDVGLLPAPPADVPSFSDLLARFRNVTADHRPAAVDDVSSVTSTLSTRTLVPDGLMNESFAYNYFL